MHPYASAPPSQLRRKTHPNLKQICDQANKQTIELWFKKEQGIQQKIRAYKIDELACLTYPLGKDERVIHVIECILILALIDDALEKSPEKASQLIRVLKNETVPDLSNFLEGLVDNLMIRIRAEDENFCSEITDGWIELLNAQAHTDRRQRMSLKDYFDVREKDVGKSCFLALLSYSMDLRFSEQEQATLERIHVLVFKHIIVMNDMASWDREWEMYTTGASSQPPLSCYPILAGELQLSIESCKTLGYGILRAIESEFLQEANSLKTSKGTTTSCHNLAAYLEALEYFMAGNEAWCEISGRYQ